MSIKVIIFFNFQKAFEMEKFEKSLNFPLLNLFPYTFDNFLCEIPHIENQIDILYGLYCRQAEDVVLRDPVIDQNIQQVRLIDIKLMKLFD